MPIILPRGGRGADQFAKNMCTILIVIAIAVGLVAFFVLGMSLTLIFKGHNIQSEISENENMRARGIKCVIQETRELDGLDDSSCEVGCGGDCGSCTPERKDEAAGRS